VRDRSRAESPWATAREAHRNPSCEERQGDLGAVPRAQTPFSENQ
jgi:hypothetical protein